MSDLNREKGTANMDAQGRITEQHVHCNGDGDGLCCARHMDGNPTGIIHPPETDR